MTVVFDYLKQVWDVFASHTWVFYPILVLTIVMWELIRFIIRKTFKTLVNLLKLIVLPIGFMKKITITDLVLLVTIVGLALYIVFTR
jgi:hypothetical protein